MSILEKIGVGFGVLILFSLISNSKNNSENTTASNPPSTQRETAVSPSKPEPIPYTSEEKEALALYINLNELLCAEVISVYLLKVGKRVVEVKCVQYRGGASTVNYIVDFDNQTVFPQ